MGKCPDWYIDMQAAKYMGVDPERLLKMPAWWRNKALVAMTAEAKAQDIRRQRGQ
jgi:hypothetical protein